MPIYEYECTSCHHHCDLIQKFSDEPAKECPNCGKNDLTKLISAAGFQLKGTGWYVTDFKNKSNAVKPSENKTADSASSASASAKSDTQSTKGDS